MARKSSDRVKLQDIADATGLSLASVSLALNDREGVSAENRRRVIQTARSLNYEKIPIRSRGARQTISVIVERLPTSITSDPFNRPILQGLERAARGSGYRIAMEFVGPEDHPDDGHWSQGGSQGLIVLGGGDLSAEWVQAAASSPLPVVLLDHVLPGMNLPSVVPDNLAGAHAMTTHLLELGHRRIGFIRGPSKYWTLSERLAGYLLALEQADVWPDPVLIPPRVSHSEEKGHGEMHQLLDLPDRPTAVMAVSDKTAVGAYRAIQERGLRIPGDISLVGFDDIEIGRSLTPPLTTVHVPGEEMGRVSFERLQHLIDNAENGESRRIRWTIPTSLVLRGSSGIAQR
jgi:LacI family transcriptional regulator